MIWALYVCSRTFTLRQGFSLCGFSTHMGSCQKQCEGPKGSSAALLNHGVPSTSQNSCRVGAGRPQIRVHWSVYIRSLSVYQSAITPVSRTIDFTAISVQENGRKVDMWSRSQLNAEFALSLNGWVTIPQDEWRIGVQSIAGNHAKLVVLFSSW